MSEPPATRPDDLTETAVYNAAANLVARVAGMLVSVVLTPFVLHRIGRDLYGVAALAGSVLDCLWLLRGGLGSGMRRFVTLHYHAGDRELANRFYAAGFWWTALLRLAVVGIGIAASRFLCGFLNVPAGLVTDAAGGLVLIFLSAGVLDLGRILEVPVYATGHTWQIAGARIAGTLLRLGFVVPAFLLFVPSLRVYAAAGLLAEICAAALLAAAAAREKTVPAIVPRPWLGDRKVGRALFAFGGISLVSQVATLLYLATDNLLIGRLYGPASVTEYSLGTRWAPVIQGFLFAGVSGLMPLFTRLEVEGDPERSRRAILRVASVITAIGLPMCLVPCVLGDAFLGRWVGPEYRHCASYLAAMLIPIAISIPLEPVWTAMAARGRIGWIAVGDVIAGVAKPVLGLVLALHFRLDLLGFALASTVALLAKFLVLRPRVGRDQGALPSTGQALAVLPRALAGAAPALLLLWILKPWYDRSLPAVIGAGVAGGALCLAGTTLAAVGFREARELLGVLLVRARRPR